MRIVSTHGATELQHDGVTYQPVRAGVFEVPEKVGRALIKFPHWMAEAAAAAVAEAEKLAHDLDPGALLDRVEELEQQLAAEAGEVEKALRAEVDALKAKLIAAEKSLAEALAKLAERLDPPDAKATRKKKPAHKA